MTDQYLAYRKHTINASGIWESVVTARFSRNQVSPLLHSPIKIQIHGSVSIIHLVSNSQVYILNSTPGSWRAALGHLGPGGNFSTRRRRGWGGGWFQDDWSLIFIVHFISTMTTSAPPQIISHQVLEVGDLCYRGHSSPVFCRRRST